MKRFLTISFVFLGLALLASVFVYVFVASLR